MLGPLTVIQILWLRISRPSNHSKLDLLETLALKTRSLFQPFLGVHEFLALEPC